MTDDRGDRSLRVAVIAEDDSDIRELVSTKLTGAGYRVIPVSNGTAALAAIRERLPDVAILDVMMPGTSGLDVIGALRGDPRTAAIPVILLSAKSQEFDVETGIASGAADYIVKPFSPRELVERVDAVLDRTRG
ncbi:MAG TPA: response regulator [Jatrophihabitans sp.]|nr:response regulator [Jatrophihabitans sp.]